MSVSGRWRIVEMDAWDQDVDLIDPGFIEFTDDATGQFGFIAVRGWMDCRTTTERDGHARVEFSWDGHDEGDQISGRGWAVVNDDGDLDGHVFIHLGEDSAFRAVPWADADEQDA